MNNIPPQFQLSFRPQAAPEAVVQLAQARFTVLTARMIRMEYDPQGEFEDRPSQPFWYRQQAVPYFEVTQSEDSLDIITEYLHFHYRIGEEGFTPETLEITLKESGKVWRYGDEETENLLGTARTLDQADGRITLEPGLLSCQGWTVVDDSQTLVFNEAGWLEIRDRTAEKLDLYFLGYGSDFRACLHDFALVTGETPLVPRWVLGNWWSRYWEYTQDELMGLMADFKQHDIPIAICIVDMDWHLVNVGEGINGWTGYTWNRELFPDPDGFIAWLHSQGIRTALNLHPALGIRSYEAAYPAVARRLGIDPESGQTIPFDIADPDFAAAYFEELHHPEEARGIDFWWLDWQQGDLSRLPGLDPLWWLNHLHYYDLGRDGKKRPFIFSRWGGLGNHRYPIGFSGDTVVTWASLSFQPYFTATAANVAYGWWSHDIGGHMFGVEEPELFTRWVQFGVFSPIFRLHSTKILFHERRPWAYDAEVYRITKDAMQLRHALIPYLYSMGWEYARHARPPIRPMYHDYPKMNEAYLCPQQYTFGTELIAAPYTTPADPDTRVSHQLVWLPPGDWYDFFSGAYHPGDRWQACYGRLDEIPVFAKAGSIVPLGPKVGWGGVDNPTELNLHIFAGANNEFLLYEDDGNTQAYQDGAYCLTAFTQEWETDKLLFHISAVSGQANLVPDSRQYHLFVYGIQEPETVKLLIDGQESECRFTYEPDRQRLVIDTVNLPREANLTLKIERPNGLLARHDGTLEKAMEVVSNFKMETMLKSALYRRLPEITADLSQLAAFSIGLTPSQIQCLLALLLEAGAYQVIGTGRENTWLIWNNNRDERATYTYARENTRVWHFKERFVQEKGIIPRSRLIQLAGRQRLSLNLMDFLATFSG
ncbi:MAG: TIM-barrel domain-containing protein [Candidatus Promineifilaceae bacterium]